jgi:ferredoxin
MAYKIDENVCVACGTCMSECPSGAISEGDVYHIDPNVCIECGSCANVCPMGAISLDEKK